MTQRNFKTCLQKKNANNVSGIWVTLRGYLNLLGVCAQALFSAPPHPQFTGVTWKPFGRYMSQAALLPSLLTRREIQAEPIKFSPPGI